MAHFGVVIVTYNRLEKLKIALNKFEKQTLLPEYILIVNNCSTDGTTKFLESWVNNNNAVCKRYLINTENNTGGSGGFYIGLKAAQELEADWIWVSDDDAFPYCNALEEANKFINNEKEISTVAAVCGAVINNGKLDLEHRRSNYSGVFLLKVIYSSIDDYSSNFNINSYSFVGTILNKEKLIKAGLPNKDYFIWFDDTEHSIRMSKQGRIVCVPSIKVEHNIYKKEGEVSWKLYYGIRNGLDFRYRHFRRNYYTQVAIWIVRIFFRRILGKEPKKTALFACAVKDQILGRFGMNNLYKPGWKWDE